MKIAIVRQKYTPFGGAERFVARALDALRARGVDVSIIARQWQGEVPGIRVDPFYLGRTWRDAGFARGVRRLIAERCKATSASPVATSTAPATVSMPPGWSCAASRWTASRPGIATRWRRRRRCSAIRTCAR
jgi:hypothetical protein